MENQASVYNLIHSGLDVTFAAESTFEKLATNPTVITANVGTEGANEKFPFWELFVTPTDSLVSP
jgi:hypothetical protein